MLSEERNDGESGPLHLDWTCQTMLTIVDLCSEEQLVNMSRIEK